MSAPFAMNSYLGKQILALVRDGDYAHAGEEEAIETALQGLAKDPGRQILDAGCGRGGTAAYMQTHGWGRVTGIDIEPNSIDYARRRYPDTSFVCCDIHAIAAHVAQGFDVVTLFNVLYALPDHAAGLRALASRARNGARLVFFDYVDPGRYGDAPIMDDGRSFLPNPPRRADLAGGLEKGGWRMLAADDLTADYARWYAALVEKIEAKREAIGALAGAEAFEHVISRYSAMLAAIREGRLGGVLAIGEKL